jgi:hypothetical protein
MLVVVLVLFYRLLVVGIFLNTHTDAFCLFSLNDDDKNDNNTQHV